VQTKSQAYGSVSRGEIYQRQEVIRRVSNEMGSKIGKYY
jgi:hypothetical protein